MEQWLRVEVEETRGHDLEGGLVGEEGGDSEGRGGRERWGGVGRRWEGDSG